MSRLRLSSHHLGIEVGRHARPMVDLPVDKRICVECEGEFMMKFIFSRYVRSINHLGKIC